MSESIVIVGAKRTPIGAMQGKFNSVTASQLGATAIKAALEQAGVGPTEVDDVIMGCVLPAGQGQAPARQAALAAVDIREWVRVNPWRRGHSLHGSQSH